MVLGDPYERDPPKGFVILFMTTQCQHSSFIYKAYYEHRESRLLIPIGYH